MIIEEMINDRLRYHLEKVQCPSVFTDQIKKTEFLNDYEATLALKNSLMGLDKNFVQDYLIKKIDKLIATKQREVNK